MRRIIVISGLGVLFTLLVATMFTQVASAINDTFYDHRTYNARNSGSGDVVQGRAEISGVAGSNSFVKKASVNFSVYFSGKTGKITFHNFHFCPSIGGDNGTGSGFGNGSNVTRFSVKYSKKNRSHASPRLITGDSFYGKKKPANCTQTKTIDVDFGNDPNYKPNANTGLYEVEISVTPSTTNSRGVVVYNTGSNIQNMFRASASSSTGSATIAHKGMGDGGDGSEVTVEQTNDSPSNIDYRIRFGVDCSLTRGSVVKGIKMFDLDNGGGSGAQLNHKINLKLEEFDHGSNNGEFIKISTNRNLSNGKMTLIPPPKDDNTQTFYFKAKKGKRYILHINKVYHNNTLQYTTPYDGIFWKTGCKKWDAEPKSHVTKTGVGWSSEVRQERGKSVTFRHRVKNEGPSDARLKTRQHRNYSGNVISSNFAAFGTQRTLNLSFNETQEVTNNFRIPDNAADGALFCQRYRINPGSSQTGAENSTKACVRVVDQAAAQYTLTPNIQLVGDSRTYSYKPNLQVRGWIDAAGAVTGTQTWQMYAMRYNSLPNTATRGDSDRDICDVVPSDNMIDDCDNIHQSMYSPSTSSHTARYASGGPDSAGTHICFITRVNNATDESDSNQWRYSNMECAVSGVNPKIQVRGGDAKVTGMIETSLSDIDTRRFGSWGEYGVLSNGRNAYMGSGGALGLSSTASGSQQSSWSDLTFRNNGAYGTYMGALMHTPVSRANARSIGAEISSMDQLLLAGKRQTIVVNGTLTIGNDLIYPEPEPSGFSSIRDIPRIIIIANNIVIKSDVRQIDPWIVAVSNLSTCDEVAGFQSLTTSRLLDSDKCSTPLQFNGPVIAGKAYLYRTHDTADGEAAETFNLRADNFLSSYAGGGSASPVATTRVIKEAPPRF